MKEVDQVLMYRLRKDVLEEYLEVVFKSQRFNVDVSQSIPATSCAVLGDDSSRHVIIGVGRVLSPAYPKKTSEGERERSLWWQFLVNSPTAESRKHRSPSDGTLRASER